tara:strand:+ start:193 stop:378 length:186 start_codon:yes stop_codon:yes gene_type:complete
MAITTTEVEKINLLYQQLDELTAKYNTALEDIHNLTNKITEYADALVKCACANAPEKSKSK